MIQSQTHSARNHLIIRRYDHALLLWYVSLYILAAKFIALNPCYLMDIKLRRLHCCFGHLSTHFLHQLLEKSRRNVELQAFQYLIKYCDQCSKRGQSPGNFAFIFKDDFNCNHNVIIDIIYIQTKSVLHLINKAIRFQAGRWLKNVSAQHV